MNCNRSGYRLRRLGTNTLVYGFGQVALKGASLVLLPLYTRVFTPEEFGIIELINLSLNLAAIVVAMGTGNALNFYFHEVKIEKNDLIGATFQWHLVTGLVLITILLLLWPLVGDQLFRGQINGNILIVALLGMLAGQLLVRVTDILRLTYRSWAYVVTTVASSCSMLALSVMFVVVLGQGIGGVFAGILCGCSVGVVVGSYALRDYLVWNGFHATLWPRMIKFGGPLVPASLATYVFHSGDRWFIRYYLGTFDVGIYAVGAKIGLLVGTLVQVFMRAFMPLSMELIHENTTSARRALEVTFRYYGGAAMGLVVMVTLLAPYLVRILAPEEYSDAAKIVGFLALSSVLFGGTYFSSLGIWRTKKTYLYTLSTCVAVGMGLVLNVILIPRYGTIGAAVGTAMAMLTLTGTSFWLSQLFWKAGFNLLIATCQMLVGLTAVILLLLGVDNVIDRGYVYGFVTVALLGLIVMTVRRSEIGALKSAFVAILPGRGIPRNPTCIDATLRKSRID